MELADRLLSDLDTHDIHTDDIDLVLELVHFPDDTVCGYYFVNHSRRCLFWLEMFDADGICDGIKVIVSRSHLSEHTAEPLSHILTLSLGLTL